MICIANIIQEDMSLHMMINKSKHNMKARATDCICLRPSIRSRNVHEFYNIATKQVITQRHCTSIPTPANVINEIEQQAKNDNMPLGITFKPIDLDSDLWLAGVEEHDEDNTNKINQNGNNNQETDINDMHEIMHDPYKFHILNHNHEPSI